MQRGDLFSRDSQHVLLSRSYLLLIFPESDFGNNFGPKTMVCGMDHVPT